MNAKRYPYRGFMLDVARHMMSVEDICRIIEAAAMCGMNRMHWHLTDDQGWRVEIRRWPRLAQMGSRRGDSHFGQVSETENNEGFFTREEVRRVVAFAAERGVEVVPELEVPGHASAMLAAYPQFGCAKTVNAPGGMKRVENPYSYRVMTVPGVFPNLICAGKDEAIRFLEDILDELLELFPGELVHIGGDEALKLHWRHCPDCQARIRAEGLRDEEELQRWLVLKVGEYLAGKGRRAIVWNESLAGGPLPGHFVVQHWRGNDAETAAFMAAGGSVICSDTEHYYLDYAYADTDAHGIWAAETPAYARGHEEGLLGVECPLWTERVTNLDRAAELLFPRLPAVALATSGRDFADWEAFRAALAELREQTAPLGLKWADEKLWKLSPADAEIDRAQDEALKRSPGCDAGLAGVRRLFLQDALEKLLAELGVERSRALRLADAAWRDQTEYCGELGRIEPEDAELADAMLGVVRKRVEEN